MGSPDSTLGDDHVATMTTIAAKNHQKGNNVVTNNNNYINNNDSTAGGIGGTGNTTSSNNGIDRVNNSTQVLNEDDRLGMNNSNSGGTAITSPYSDEPLNTGTNIITIGKEHVTPSEVEGGDSYNINSSRTTAEYNNISENTTHRDSTHLHTGAASNKNNLINYTATGSNISGSKKTLKWIHVIKTKSYWCIWSQFILTESVGSGVFMANLALLTGSLGYTQSQRDTIVIAVSIFQIAGRALIGYFSDIFITYLAKARYFIITALFILFGVITAIFLEDTFLENTFLSGRKSFLPFLLIGIGYGGNFAIMPAYYTSVFGKSNMVFCFTSTVLPMAIGVKICSMIAGAEYDQAKERQDNEERNDPNLNPNNDPNFKPSEFCRSTRDCFGHIGYIAMGMCLGSLLIGGMLIWFERRYERKRILKLKMLGWRKFIVMEW